MSRPEETGMSPGENRVAGVVGRILAYTPLGYNWVQRGQGPVAQAPARSRVRYAASGDMVDKNRYCREAMSGILTTCTPDAHDGGP
jgi:hypothetical protein